MPKGTAMNILIILSFNLSLLKVYLNVKIYGQKVKKMVKKVKEQSQLKNVLSKNFGYQEKDKIFQEQNHELILVPSEQKITGNCSFIVIKEDGNLASNLKCLYPNHYSKVFTMSMYS